MPRKPPPPRGPQLELAGAPCVAFVNTAGARKKNRQLGLTGYGELVTWGQQAGFVSTREAEAMRRRAAKHPDEAAAVFARAAAVRAALFRIFLAVMGEKHLPADDLKLISEAWASAMPAVRLVPGEPGVVVGWAGDEDALDRMLWPVLHSAAELLVSLEGRPDVKQCAAKGCLLFFVDRTRSRKRLWCQTRVCGHRVASLAHYHRFGRKGRQR
ncbi:MAG: hypothetical protein GY719_20635 [bacterium]|nr:hypothetical protein [bacterium]